MIKLINVPSLYEAMNKTIEFCKTHNGQSFEIIVPDKLSLFMERFIFEKLNISCSFDIKISTLNRFAKKTCPIDKSKQISKVGSILLIHKILNDNLDHLKVLKNKAYSFSYAENIFKTIEQLKASKIGYEEMLNFKSENEQLCSKILDLAFVYEQYEIGKAGLLDSSDAFLMSTLTVAKGKENRIFLFVGFDDFTAIEYSIIEQLAKCNEVNILNCFSLSNNKHIYNNEIYYQLKNIAQICELGFECEALKADGNSLKDFLQDNLFGLKDEKFLMKNQNVQIFSGNGIESEIEFVAREIRNGVLSKDKYSSFGLMVYDLEGNADKIKEIFNKYEINCYFDSDLSLNKSVFYKFLCSVFKYNLESYNLVHLIDLINSPFFTLSVEEKQKLIERLRFLKFKGKVTEKLSLGEEYEFATNELIAFTKNLNFQSKEVLGCAKQINEFCVEFEIDNILNKIEESVSVENKILIKKSREITDNLFEEIKRFNPDITLEDFFDVFSHISSVVKINNLPLTLDAVKIVDASDGMEIFENLYILNCTSQMAPNMKFDCGIILDTEIEKLNFSHKLSPTIAHINKLSKLRLYNLALMFEKSLTVTFSTSPSELIKELTQKLQVETDGSIENLKMLYFQNDINYFAISKWDYIEYLYKNNKNNLNIDEKIIKNKEFLNISDNNLNIFKNKTTISASQLENYFKCPFNNFVNNILKIRPMLDNDILSLDVGNILHDIVYEFYRLKKQVGDLYEFCKKEVYGFVDKDERLKINIKSPVLSNLIEEAVRVLNGLNYIDENSNFVAKEFEFEFKNDTALKLENVNIIGKVDRVDVCGDMLRIIDYKSGKADASLKELYYGEKLQLFLYACAMENCFDKKVVGEFYLPLHNAYTRELGNTYSLKGFFINEDFVIRSFDKRLTAGIKSDIVNVKMAKDGKAMKYSNKELESKEMTLLKNYSKLVSENAYNELASGYIKPSPSDSNCMCDYCPYSAVCMRESNGYEVRAVNKVDLTSFKEEEDG